MRNFKAKSGPFSTRPFYERVEIERTCSEELRSLGLLPERPEPIRIERFIEKRFKVSPRYEDLEEGVLGFSSFGANGLEEIVISKALDDDDILSSERRLRSTLAHEAGHALFQGHLFALGKKPKHLFDDGLTAPKILCRESPDADKTMNRYSGKWWEYQADQAIGSLLMPQSLVDMSLVGLLSGKGIVGIPFLESDKRSEAVNILASKFNVNPAAARVRIDLLYPTTTTRQLTL